MTPPIDIFERIQNDPQLALHKVTEANGFLPYFRALDGAVGSTVSMDGCEVIMLGSNNYLGLTQHPRVIEGARQALDRYGTGLGGSRLFNGTTRLHEALEAALAEWFEKDAALVFTTGYQANLALMSALPDDQDSVVCDSSNHASILDGLAMSSGQMRPFRHARMDKLEGALKRASRSEGGIFVIVDGIYSMEGDIANLPAITELCERYGARLAVDEAHAVGVLGERGTGTAELFGVTDKVDIRIGTLSKALAASGGFVVGSSDVITYLRLKARAFLFTAAGAPAALGAALAAVEICRSDEGRERFAALLENARYLRAGLADLGVRFDEEPGGPDGTVVTPIIPVVTGETVYTGTLWASLWNRGVFSNVALFPAVALARQQLRLSVMSTHTREQLDRALEAYEQAVPEARLVAEQVEPVVQAAVAVP
jgi:8-amino-7-oxononanoate synthase